MLQPKGMFNLSGNRHRLDLAGGTITVVVVWSDATTEAEMVCAADDMRKAMQDVAAAIRSQQPITVEVSGE